MGSGGGHHFNFQAALAGRQVYQLLQYGGVGVQALAVEHHGQGRRAALVQFLSVEGNMVQHFPLVNTGRVQGRGIGPLGAAGAARQNRCQ